MAKQISFNIKLSVDGKEQLVTATASTKELKKAMDTARDSSSSLRATMMTLASVTTVANSLSSAFSSLQGQLQGLSKTFANAEQANTKLATVMRQRMSANDEDVASVKKVISAQTELGIIGGTVQKSGAQQVATFLQHKESLEALIPAMNNLLAQQKGVNATQEDAVGIGNLMGKAMQGQTSALRRVGITFNEAEEEVMKFGDESERASMLAQIITNNVGNMNTELAKTSAGQLKQLENSFGSIKVKIGEIAIQALPFVSMAAQSAMLLTSITNLISGLKAFNVVAALTAARTTAVAVASKAAQVATVTYTAVCRYLQGALTGVAAGATTAKVAIRGLMISTGVGAALAALGVAIELVTSKSDKAKKSTDDFIGSLNEEREAAKSVQSSYDSALKQTYGDLMAKYDQLKTGWNALSSSAQQTKWIREHQSEFNNLGISINSVTDAEKVFNGNTDAIVKAFKKRAEAAAYAAKLTSLYQRQIELQDAKTGILKKARKTAQDMEAFDSVDRQLKAVGSQIESTSKAAAEASRQGSVKSVGGSTRSTRSTRSVTPKATVEKPKAAGSIDWYEEQIQKLNQRINATADKDIAANLVLQREAYEKALKGLKVEVGLEKPDQKEVRTHAEELKDALDEAQRRFDNAATVDAKVEAALNVSEIQRQIDAETRGVVSITADVEPDYIVKGSASDIRQSYKNAQGKASRVQEDYEIGLIGADEAQAKVAEINRDLAGLGANLKPITIEIETEEAKSALESFKEGFDGFKGIADATDGVVSSVSSLVGSLESGADAWTVFMNVVNAASSVLSGVSAIAEIINGITGLSTAKKVEETAAATAATAAKGADAAASGASAAATLPVVAANKAAAASFLELASAAYFAAHAYIPFAGYGIGLGFASAAAAYTKSVGALAAFATGGIVGGGSTSGDRELIRVNAGEMVLNKRQQSRLFALLDGQRRLTLPRMDAPTVQLDVARLGSNLESASAGGTVRFEIRGRKLVGALANETRVSSKSGRRTGIVI